jgi:hypothetical protein
VDRAALLNVVAYPGYFALDYNLQGYSGSACESPPALAENGGNDGIVPNFWMAVIESWGAND